MSETTAFEGSVPENYNRYLGPVLFEPYAIDLAQRLDPAQHRRVLEIACGTGIVTRQLRRRLAPEATLVATDLKEGMLACAKSQLDAHGEIEWQQADATALPFADGSFDAVVCQFGIMFVPDKEAAMREAFRVLRAHGVYLFSTWDSLDENPGTRVAHEKLAQLLPDNPPRFYETPFGYHDAAAIRRSLERSGFSRIECEVVRLPCISRSARDFALGLVTGSPIFAELQERPGVRIEELVDGVADALGKEFGREPLETFMQALVWRAVR